MNFNGNSVSSTNQLPNSMSTPPCLDLRDGRSQGDKEKERLQLFWQKQLFNIQADEAFKSQLPLARIRRTMKSVGDVQMISYETPDLVAKACEIFIQELTLRASMNSDARGKKKAIIMQPCDIAKAIMKNDAFDFLTDVIPSELLQDCAPDAMQQENAGNLAEGSQATLPHAVGLVGNPEMDMSSDLVAGNQQFPQVDMMQLPFMPLDQWPNDYQPMDENVENFIEGSQTTLPHTNGFMGNPGMDMDNDLVAGNQQFPQAAMMQQPTTFDQWPYNYEPMDENFGNFAEGSQATLPYTDGFMANPVMDMDSDLLFGNQQLQADMMQPPFMDLNHFSYNYQPW